MNPSVIDTLPLLQRFTSGPHLWASYSPFLFPFAEIARIFLTSLPRVSSLMWVRPSTPFLGLSKGFFSKNLLRLAFTWPTPLAEDVSGNLPPFPASARLSSIFFDHLNNFPKIQYFSPRPC